MDKRTKNRIQEHKTHKKEIQRIDRPQALNFQEAGYIVCDCGWFGWIEKTYLKDMFDETTE